MNDELESFLFNNCMTAQEQIYPLVKFWQHLFRHDVINPDTVNQEVLAEFNQVFKHQSSTSNIFSLQNLNRALLILTVMDDFFEVDVANLLAKSEDKRRERMKQQVRQSSTQSLHERVPSKKDEIRLFFDSLFGNLGLNLSKTVEVAEKTHLSDYVYAKVRKLCL